MSINNNVLYDLTLSKGKLDNNEGELSVYMWDALTICPGNEKCDIYARCPYRKKEGQKCRIETNYMNAIYAAFLPIIEKSDDMMIRVKIGMQIVPLYLQLCRLKMTELALNGKTCYQTPRGTMATHPVYKSIQDTMRAINLEINGPFVTYIKSLGFYTSRYADLAGPQIGQALSGDPGYYAQMEHDDGDRS